MNDANQEYFIKSIKSVLTPRIQNGLGHYKYQDAHLAVDRFGRPRIQTPREKGRFDNQVFWGNHMVFVEVKNAGLVYEFGAMDQDKRDWADFMMEKYNSSLWVYLTMGSERPNLQPSNADFVYRKQSWLVEWKYLEWLETYYTDHANLKSIHKYWADAKSKYIRERQWDIRHWLSAYELPYFDGVFRIRNHHDFLREFGE